MQKLVTLLCVLAIASTAHAGVIDKLVDRPIKALFEKMAAKKGGRAFHTEGVAYKATMTTPDGKERPATVRFSRGGATSAGKPDIMGVAVKTTTDAGRDQDFLMVAARGDHGIKSRLPRFVGSLSGQSVSSLTSYRADGLKGAITTTLPEGFRTPIDVTGQGGTGAARQSFSMSLNQGGPFYAHESTSLGTVTVHFDEPMTGSASTDLHFTPWHDGAGVEPVGLINRLRKPAYIGSEEGRGLVNPN